ncbi:MAG: radical SAM protein [Anaerolineae bacterium]
MLFQQETAETALLDLEGLDALYFLLKGELRDYPPFFVAYLRAHRFVVEAHPDGSLERVAAVRDAAPTAMAPPRALAAPETIHFSVTGRCDQACAGCLYSARPGSGVAPTDAPFELFERIVRQAAEARVFQMALGGGEPLLHSRPLDMVRLARQSGIVPNLTTNGNLLTVEVAAALKKAGLGQAQISLNGASERTNSATRPNFTGALQAVEACREAGLRFGLNVLLTRSNLPDLEAVIRLGQHKRAATVNLLRPKPPLPGVTGWSASPPPPPTTEKCPTSCAIQYPVPSIQQQESPYTPPSPSSSPTAHLRHSTVLACGAARRLASSSP